jgi:hypothetical protein
MGFYIKAAALAAVFLLAAANLFSQDESPQRGSIPEELLRPSRGESPRYPIDTVIGELGQGNAPKEAYDCARRAADAFFRGTATASVFSSVDKVFIESCINALKTINPRYYRLGGGREEPDGSVSFLIRFAGRDEGIIGELFIRQEQKRIPLAVAPVETVPEAAQNEEKSDPKTNDNADPETTDGGNPKTNDGVDLKINDGDDPETNDGDEDGTEEIANVPPEPPVRIEILWVFEDIILEEARSRDAENDESRHKFDFPPYERFF